VNRPALLGALLLLAACSSDPNDDVPPLPKPTDDTARALMQEAEGAAANAQRRAEQTDAPARSATQTNEETP